MMRRLLNILAVAAWMVLPATGQTCDPSPQRHAVHITSEPPGEDFAEVAGDRSFYQVLDNGWVFALMRAEEGWSLRVFDRAPIGDAVDLTSLTPPRAALQIRGIYSVGTSATWTIPDRTPARSTRRRPCGHSSFHPVFRARPDYAHQTDRKRRDRTMASAGSR